MTESTSSSTALLSAAARAAHALVDAEPLLLEDPVAQLLCESATPSPLGYQLARPDATILAAARFSTCARSAFADHTIIRSPGDQVLVLGAGLDTTAHRLAGTRPPRRTWVADLPGVLAWRKELFGSAGVPDAATAVPMDLRDGIDWNALAHAGFTSQRPTTIVWLGVSMYLSRAECIQLFAGLHTAAPDSALALDYVLPEADRDGAGGDYAAVVAAMAGQSGEPWGCTPRPAEVHGWLQDAGWRVDTDIEESAMAPDGFWQAQPHLSPMRLVRLVSATRRA